MDTRSPLARRLGKTVHASPLRFKLERLRKLYPLGQTDCIEDWLVLTANTRGARVVLAPPRPESSKGHSPPVSALTDEELVIAICQPNGLDRPQMLRLAAQLISRGALDLERLSRLAVLERAAPVLAELSRQALRIDPHHPVWRFINQRFSNEPPLRDALLHWTRLAEPVMRKGKPNPAGWRLVA